MDWVECVHIIKNFSEDLPGIKENIEAIQKSLNDPKNGVIVKLEELLRWKKIIGRVSWLVFASFVAGTIGIFFS